MNLFESIGVPVDYVIIGIIGLCLVLLILLICTMASLSKLKKNYKVFMSGKEGKSLEEAIIKKFKLVDMLDESVKDIYAQIKVIDSNLLTTYQKIGLVKYDAFKDVGGKMSFVFVLLTKENNGIMMNCMHSNSEGCYTYVKRIERGTCKLAISKEEELALNKALGVADIDDEIEK